jgi:hypothetical protein
MAQNISRYLNPAKILGRNTFIRKLFGKKPVEKRVHFWLYHPEDTMRMLQNSNFKSNCAPETFRVEVGLTILPFFRPIF